MQTKFLSALVLNTLNESIKRPHASRFKFDLGTAHFVPWIKRSTWNLKNFRSRFWLRNFKPSDGLKTSKQSERFMEMKLLWNQFYRNEVDDNTSGLNPHHTYAEIKPKYSAIYWQKINEQINNYDNHEEIKIKVNEKRSDGKNKYQIRINENSVLYFTQLNLIDFVCNICRHDTTIQTVRI